MPFLRICPHSSVGSSTFLVRKRSWVRIPLWAYHYKEMILRINLLDKNKAFDSHIIWLPFIFPEASWDHVLGVGLFTYFSNTHMGMGFTSTSWGRVEIHRIIQQ